MTSINNNQMSEGLNKEVLVSRTLACGCHWEFGKQTKWCKAHGNQTSELKEKIEEILKNRHFLTTTVLTDNKDGSGTISMKVEPELVDELLTLISHERAEAVKQFAFEAEKVWDFNFKENELVRYAEKHLSNERGK